MMLSAEQARRLSEAKDGQLFLRYVEFCVREAARRGHRYALVNYGGYCLSDEDLDEVEHELKRVGYRVGAEEDSLCIEW